MGSHILITPIEYCILVGRTNKRYCFKCRKRYVHYKVVTVWGGETGMWYEPSFDLCCAGCGDDHLRMF